MTTPSDGPRDESLAPAMWQVNVVLRRFAENRRQVGRCAPSSGNNQLVSPVAGRCVGDFGLKLTARSRGLPSPSAVLRSVPRPNCVPQRCGTVHELGGQRRRSPRPQGVRLRCGPADGRRASGEVPCESVPVARTGLGPPARRPRLPRTSRLRRGAGPRNASSRLPAAPGNVPPSVRRRTRPIRRSPRP